MPWEDYQPLLLSVGSVTTMNCNFAAVEDDISASKMVPSFSHITISGATP